MCLLNSLQAQLAKTLLSLPPLGLSLGKTPSFLNLTEKLPRKRKTKRAAEVNVQSMSEKEKLKASNFCASLLRIGSWQVGSFQYRTLSFKLRKWTFSFNHAHNMCRE